MILLLSSCWCLTSSLLLCLILRVFSLSCALACQSLPPPCLHLPHRPCSFFFFFFCFAFFSVVVVY